MREQHGISSPRQKIDRKWICILSILIILLSGCAAQATGGAGTLPPRPTSPATATHPAKPAPTETGTLTPQPTVTETHKPRPTPVFPKACGTVTLGKPGTQTQDKIHPVLIEGTAILCNDAFRPEENDQITSFPIAAARLDLDTGLTGTGRTDIWFEVGCGSMCFDALFSDNDAQVENWGFSDHPKQPTYDQCASLASSSNPDNEPAYVCVITTEGHVARVKAEQYDPLEHVISMKVSFITWATMANTPTPTP